MHSAGNYKQDEKRMGEDNSKQGKWDKGLISRIHKQLIQFNMRKKQPNQKVGRRPKQTILQRRHQFSSVQFSCSVVSDFLRPHGLQHAKLPCPSPTPGPGSNSCPSSQWCHPTISSSVVPFSHLQSFPASEAFQMSQLFTSGGQSIGVSASASVLPKNIQDWFPLVSACSLRDT